LTYLIYICNYFRYEGPNNKYRISSYSTTRRNISVKSRQSWRPSYFTYWYSKV